jgi:AmmeMemoRadiSam system protein A
MLIAVGATQELPLQCEVLSYEAPFGVGYMVAQLTSKQITASDERKSVDMEIESEGTTSDAYESGGSLPALAREAVENFVREGTQIDPPSECVAVLHARAACFVSLKTKSGELRGCIGTIEPSRDTLAEEIISNAINAASRDPRFAPVAPEELDNLRYSVDVLSAPEPADIGDLDPAIYGVIVEDETGWRRGLLLPALEGIETVSQQVEIAARKAGIPPETPVKLSRFSVGRYGEG